MISKFRIEDPEVRSILQENIKKFSTLKEFNEKVEELIKNDKLNGRIEI